MGTAANPQGTQRDTRVTLALLWTWALFNYVYGDILHIFTIFTRPDLQRQLASGALGGIPLDGPATLAMAAVMELSIAMPFLTWQLGYRSARLLNILVGLLFTLIMAGILFGSGRLPPPNGYTLYGLIEIVITLAIVLIALRWRKAEAQSLRL